MKMSPVNGISALMKEAQGPASPLPPRPRRNQEAGRHQTLNLRLLDLGARLQDCEEYVFLV